MTKFECVGIEFQQDALTMREAERCMQNSCAICCKSGLRVDCDHCGIRQAHLIKLAALEIVAQPVVKRIPRKALNG